MNRSTFIAPMLALAAVFATMPVGAAHAQLRRSPGDGSGPAPAAPQGIPRNARLPFAGVWDGTFTLITGPGADRNIPIVMVLAIADSAKGLYGGATILPNGARAPHLETTVVNGEIHWKQENSGGGYWAYTGKLVARDSIAGTVALKEWPQLPAGEKPPTGTIALVRRPVGK